MKRFYLFFIILFLISFSNTTLSYIEKLQVPYSEYEQLLKSEPDKVLALLKAKAKNSTLQEAQKNLLLSFTYYILVYPDEALNMAQEAIKLINETSEPWLYHNSKIAESMAFDISGSANLGMDGAKKALIWARNNNNKELEISALVALGHLHTTSVQYVSALEYLQKAYNLASNESKTHRSEVAGIIAILYEERRENELSIPYFEESAEYHRSTANYIELSIALYGLGRAKANIGYVEDGKKLLQESIDISSKVNDLQGVAYAQKELAGIAMSEKKYDKALSLLNNALEVFETANNKFMLFDVHKILADLYLKTQHLNKAKQHQVIAKTYIKEENQPLQNISLEKLTARILFAKGDYQRAYAQLHEAMIKEKRLTAKQSTQLLHLLRSEFDLENKEKENQILATKNELQNIKLEAETQKNHVLKLLFISALIILGLLAILIVRTRKHKLRFQYIANHDSLTGLFNRNYILDNLEVLFQSAKANHLELCIAMIDLDHFKSVNDTFGHSVGDQILKQVARIFHYNLGEYDLSGRFGGEEFLLVFPQQNLKQAKIKLNDIRLATIEISQRLKLNNHRTSLSAGICSLQSNSSYNNIGEMIKCADDALYQAKFNGRNTIVIG
jgi:diguanylate cyclase (GGDEF)-like protein